MSSLPFLGIGETVSAGRRLQVKLREGSREGGREGGREIGREGREMRQVPSTEERQEKDREACERTVEK
jgi:hypothetical protein